MPKPSWRNLALKGHGFSRAIKFVSHAALAAEVRSPSEVQSLNMRPAFNPARRNRNIGTSKQGHGQNNRMKIPVICHDERVWWEQLQEHTVISRVISGRGIKFIVEKVLSGFTHACSVADICRLLEFIPSEDWEGIGAVVFRQSTRKQEILMPVWGRLAYSADIGKPAKPNIYSGPAIFLEAQCTKYSQIWSKSLDPDDQRELSRLRGDGHIVRDSGKNLKISGDQDAIRATQLYRTLLHELGHWVDFQTNVERASGGGLEKWEKLSDLYFARSVDERETFAHKYADTKRAELIKFGRIPFDRIPDE